MNSTLLTNVAVIVTWVLTLGGTVWFLATDRQQVVGVQQAHAEKIKDYAERIMANEQRLRTVEDMTRDISADVRWIRMALGKWSGAEERK